MRILLPGLELPTWSYFNKLDLLTDVTMRTPRKLFNIVQERNCAPWKFCQSTLQVASASKQDLTTLLLNNGANRNVTMTPRVGYRIKKREINRIWQLLRTGKISTVRFLTMAVPVSNFLLNIIRFQGEYASGEFEPRNPDIPIVHDAPEIVVDAPAAENALGNADDLLVEINFDQYRQLVRERSIGEHVDDINDSNNSEEEDEHEVPEVMLSNRGEIVFEHLCLQCHIHPLCMIAKHCNCLCLVANVSLTYKGIIVKVTSHAQYVFKHNKFRASLSPTICHSR